MLLYQQLFYRVSFSGEEGDIGSARRAQIAKATLALGEVDGVLIATCCGGRYASEPSEVALVMPVDEDADSMLAHVLKAVTDQASDASVTQREGFLRYYTFNDEQKENVEQVTRIGGMDAAWQAIDACFASPSKHIELAPSSSSVVPPQQSSEPFMVTRTKYLRFRGARDSYIEDEYHSLLAAFEALSSEDNLNAVIVIMIANGLLTFGNEMREAYTTVPWAGSLAVWLGELISAAGGMPVVIPAAARISGLIATLFVALKDVRCGLIFANGTAADINFLNDSLMSGERKAVAPVVHGAHLIAPKPHAYECGMFVYKKHALFHSVHSSTEHPHPALLITPTPGFSIGFFESTAGIAFELSDNGAKFSLGMSSPTLERNSVCVTMGDDAQQAAKIADDTAMGENKLKVGNNTCTIRHASEWGNVNYCICTLD